MARIAAITDSRKEIMGLTGLDRQAAITTHTRAWNHSCKAKHNFNTSDTTPDGDTSSTTNHQLPPTNDTSAYTPFPD